MNGLTSLYKNLESTSQYIWWLWLLTILIVFFVQLITLDDLLLIYQDQVQIIDYGRLTLNPNSDWSLAWRIEEGKPILLWSYIGPLIAEMSFNFGGPLVIGSRIASLIGGMAAATMAFGWLKSRRVPDYAAFGLSLAFLIDPLFVLSQRIGRMDSWVMALCLASCWILSAAIRKQNPSLPKEKLILAGSIAGISALTWPSAVFLFPLIFLELLDFKEVKTSPVNKWRIVIPRLLYFGIGGIGTTILLLIPIWESLVIIFNDMTTMIARNINSSRSFSENFFSIFEYQLWFKLIKAYIKTLTPFFPLLALVGCFFHKEKGLIFVTFISIATIFASLVYELRALYLLPYFLGLIGGVFLKFKKNTFSMKIRRLGKISLYVLVFWALGISLIVRTALGLENKNHQQEEIFEIAKSLIGPGNYKVFLGFTYEFYFVGRSLKWQLYSPYIKYEYDSEGNWINDSKYEPEEKFVALLSKMDYAIFQKNAVDEKLREQLNMSGLFYTEPLFLNDHDKEIGKDNYQNRTKEIIMWYLQGNMTNSSYVLYSRQKKKVSDTSNTGLEPSVLVDQTIY